MWRRLSVFAGGFGLAAAEAVCSGAGLERDQIVDLVGRLVDASILTMAHGGRHGRFRLLETVRLYGAERLREAGEDRELRYRHAAWYANLISPADRPWWGAAEQVDMLDLLDVEWANVEAALDFCGGSPADAEPELLELGPRMAARRVSEQTGGDRELGYALMGLGLVRMRLMQTGQAIELLAASRETMTGVDDAFGRALGLYFYATAMAAAGRVADARRLALEGLDASDRAGNKFGQGNVNTLLGIVEG